jgi:RNA polymerase sigma factor (sigma-70 family)
MPVPPRQPEAALPPLVAFLANRTRRDTAARIETQAEQADREFRDWTRRISRGDEHAFTHFYELYHLRIYKYLLALTRGNEHDAREVLQTVILKAAKSFKVFPDDQRLWAWLCRLSRNAYIDLLRRKNRDSRFVPIDDRSLDFAAAEPSKDRTEQAFADAMAQLPEEEQELVREAYVDKRPLQQLAIEAGSTYKAMESRLGRLRLKLKTNVLTLLRNENRS